MKVSKEARKLSRQLLQRSFTDGRLDSAKVKAVVEQVVASKPRDYFGALKNFHRLVRLELDKRHAIVESAAPLNYSTSWEISQTLKERHGSDVTTEFKVNPELLGGLRIKLGSTVWDGSIQTRLAKLEQGFNAQ
jgi:F-type H+-transporting ATPase subunit delta